MVRRVESDEESQSSAPRSKKGKKASQIASDDGESEVEEQQSAKRRKVSGKSMQIQDSDDGELEDERMNGNEEDEDAEGEEPQEVERSIQRDPKDG
jgi:hypothetical protein